MEERFQKHKEFLVDRIDPDFGLLDKLLANETLTREAVHRIKLKDNTTEDKNRILLDFIMKNKKAHEFVSALTDSGQTHLVNYLKTDGGYGLAFGDDWPLSEPDIRRLDINRESLIDLLDTTDLCIRLFSDNVINIRQRQFICSKSTHFEKNEALLDMLTKFSLRQYKKTIACMNDSNQSHIANLLSDGGVLVRVHANLEGATGNVDELEDEIITEFRKVLENRPLDEAIQLLDHTKLRIIAVKKGHSIVIYIHCKSHDKLLQLGEFLRTKKLQEIVEKVFIELLSIGDALRVSLTWSSEEFTTAATYFDPGDVSLSGDLQSTLIVAERSSFSTLSVEKSRHEESNMISRLGDADNDMYEMPSEAAVLAKQGFSGGGGGGSNLKSLISRFETNSPSQDQPERDIRWPITETRNLKTLDGKGKAETINLKIGKAETINLKAGKVETRNLKTGKFETRNLETGTSIAKWATSRKESSIATRPPQPPPFNDSRSSSPALPPPWLSNTDAILVDPATGRKYRRLQLLPQPPNSRPPKKPSKPNQIRKLNFKNFIR